MLTIMSFTGKGQQEYNPANLISIGHIDSLYSEILEESRDLWVYLPQAASNQLSGSAKYPVVVQLNGDAYFTNFDKIIYFKI